MFSFRGQGAKLICQSIFDSGNLVSLETFSGNKVDVVVTSSYKHMGVLLTSDGRQSTEIASRCGQVTSTCRNLRLVVLGSHTVHESTKLSLVQSLLLSVFFYNAQLWSKLCPKDWRRLSACYIRLCRSAIGMHNHRTGMRSDKNLTAHDLRTRKKWESAVN